MTEEQIKALKVGDKIRVEYSIVGVHNDFVVLKDSEDVCCTTQKIERGTLARATLVTPPPTFEIGDTVRIVPDPLTGHVHSHEFIYDQDTGSELPIRKINTVKGYAILDGNFYIDIHCLELVKKAVKDKYIVRKIRDGWGVFRVEEDNFKRSCAEFVEETHPNAEAAAEAECERLNKEWRKQQESAAVCDSGETKGGAE